MAEIKKELVEHKVKSELVVMSKDEKTVVKSSHFGTTVNDVYQVELTTDMTSAFRFNAERENSVKHAKATAKKIDGKLIRITTTTITTSMAEEVSYNG
jgi:hypothetical protein